jgi:hypothetical protein
MTDNADDCQCQGNGCCSPQSGPGGKSPLKVVLFSIIVIAAMSVTAYSLFVKEPPEVGSCGSSCGPDEVCGDLTNIEPLKPRLAGLQFAYLVINDTNGSDSELAGLVDSAVDSLKVLKVKAGSISLNPDDPGYAEAVDYFELDQFPIAIAIGCTVDIIINDDPVTLTGLLKAWRRASAPATSKSTLTSITSERRGCGLG